MVFFIAPRDLGENIGQFNLIVKICERYITYYIWSVDEQFTGAIRAEILIEHSVFDGKYSKKYKNKNFAIFKNWCIQIMLYFYINENILKYQLEN